MPRVQPEVSGPEPAWGCVQESVILSRAIREHARRQGQDEGFSSSPGDCMAYKHYRDVSPAPTSQLHSSFVGVAAQPAQCPALLVSPVL